MFNNTQKPATKTNQLLKFGESLDILSRERGKPSKAVIGGVSVEQDDLKRPYLNKETIASSNVCKEICAISLFDFGLSTIVLTSHEDIAELVSEYQHCSGKGWSNVEVEEVYQILFAELRRLEIFFNSNPKLVDKQNPDWINYCDGCLAVYVLDAFLTNKQFNILHPQSYAKLLNNGAIDATSGLVSYYMHDVN